jgi:hypothetical protein
MCSLLSFMAFLTTASSVLISLPHEISSAMLLRMMPLKFSRQIYRSGYKDELLVLKKKRGQFHIISIQRRLGDHAFSNARTWPEIQQAHQIWWKNYNSEHHYAHRERQLLEWTTRPVPPLAARRTGRLDRAYIAHAAAPVPPARPLAWIRQVTVATDLARVSIGYVGTTLGEPNRSARKSSQVRVPSAWSGVRLAPARCARAA